MTIIFQLTIIILFPFKSTVTRDQEIQLRVLLEERIKKAKRQKVLSSDQKKIDPRSTETSIRKVFKLSSLSPRPESQVIDGT